MGCTPDPLTTTLSGNQSNFSLSTSATALMLRCDNSSPLTIHGVAAGQSGQQLTIISVGSGQVDIVNQSATETTAANRIINGVTGTISLAAGTGRATLEYDGVTARWRVIEHEQGAWIAPAFSAADFTGSGAMTWTVQSADVVTYKYRLSGTTLTVAIVLNTTSVGGTPAAYLQVKIPGGFTALTETWNFVRLGDGATAAVAMLVVLAGETVIRCYRDLAGTANWGSSTNTTFVMGELIFEVS